MARDVHKKVQDSIVYNFKILEIVSMSQEMDGVGIDDIKHCVAVKMNELWLHVSM